MKDNAVAEALEAIDARLRGTRPLTQQECFAAVNDLLAFMDKHAPTIIAALKAKRVDEGGVS